MPVVNFRLNLDCQGNESLCWNGIADGLTENGYTFGIPNARTSHLTVVHTSGDHEVESIFYDADGEHIDSTVQAEEFKQENKGQYIRTFVQPTKSGPPKRFGVLEVVTKKQAPGVLKFTAKPVNSNQVINSISDKLETVQDIIFIRT